MTPNKPIPADPCQTEKIPSCAQQQTPFESGKSMQEPAIETPTLNLLVEGSNPSGGTSF
jgi:hypothetical protein